MQTDLVPLSMKITGLLQTETYGSSQEAKELHEKQRPLSLEMLGKYAILIDKD